MWGQSGREHGDDPRIQSGRPHRFKAPRQDDLDQNAGTIHMSNPEHLLVFKAPCGDNPKETTGKIFGSNPEQVLVFKAPHGDNSEQNAGTIHDVE